LPRRKAEGIAAGDPRLSIEERYPTKGVYLAAFKKAADDLAAKRFLLPDDADVSIKSAQAEGVRNAP
jgi:Alpha/beta hydrolase domain